MIYIAHRGNTVGPSDKENHPDHITKALLNGYDVEIDVWRINGGYVLGHDEPQYPVSLNFLSNSRFWCHAKNPEALEMLLFDGCHCFWHQDDDYTLTSKGIPWVYPGKKLVSNSVWVMPEVSDIGNPHRRTDIYGVCSDFASDDYSYMFNGGVRI